MESLNNWCVFLACCPEEHYVKVIIFSRMKHLHIFFCLVMCDWIVWEWDVMCLQVHNWTVEQTSEWLATNVELPQYIPNFIQHRVTGATLPRLLVIFHVLKVFLALNSIGFVSEVKVKFGQRKNEHWSFPACLPIGCLPCACLPPTFTSSHIVLSLLLHSWISYELGYESRAALPGCYGEGELIWTHDMCYHSFSDILYLRK
jgi:hypothetical protein